LQQKLFALWPDSGTLPNGFAGRVPDEEYDRSFQSAIASFSEEKALLNSFQKIYGCPPLLNKRPPENLGNPPTTSELRQWLQLQFEDEERIPTDSVIRLRAYQKWRERGRPLGDEWTDWFAAEVELWEDAILEAE